MNTWPIKNGDVNYYVDLHRWSCRYNKNTIYIRDVYGDHSWLISDNFVHWLGDYMDFESNLVGAIDKYSILALHYNKAPGINAYNDFTSSFET